MGETAKLISVHSEDTFPSFIAIPLCIVKDIGISFVDVCRSLLPARDVQVMDVVWTKSG